MAAKGPRHLRRGAGARQGEAVDPCIAAAMAAGVIEWGSKGERSTPFGASLAPLGNAASLARHQSSMYARACVAYRLGLVCGRCLSQHSPIQRDVLGRAYQACKLTQAVWREERSLRLFPPILSKPKLLRQCGACSGICGCHHRIVARQVPLRAVLIWGHPKSAEMPLKRLEFLPIVETDDMVGANRLTNRNGRGKGCWLLRFRRRLPISDSCQSPVHGSQEVRQLADLQVIVGYKSRHNLSS